MKGWKPLGLWSQIVIVLTFFACMLLNYLLIYPVYENEEAGRVVGELNSYCSYYLRNIRYQKFDNETIARLYEESDWHDNSNEHFMIIDPSGEIMFSSEGLQGSGMHLIDSLYGKIALAVVDKDMAAPLNSGTLEYDPDRRMFYFARYDSGLDLVMFFAVDYMTEAGEGARRFIILFYIMLAGGTLIMVICFINMRLLAHKTISELNAKRDLDTASSIQQSMLPKGRRRLIQLDIDAQLTPALKIGGDLYYYYLQDGLLYFCVGDVSGKGVPASLYMARAVTLFRNMAQTGRTPCEIASRMNEELCHNNDQYFFLTAFIGTLDVHEGWMTYCNAGHNEPLYWDGSPDSPVMLLKTSVNVPLGFDKSSKFSESSMRLGKGFMLLLYTDGVTEARNRNSKLYGNDKLISMLNLTKSMSARDINDRLMSDIREYADGMEQSDDITLLALRGTSFVKTLNITNDINELKALKVYINDVIREFKFDGRERVRIRSGLDEAVTNCVRYAYDVPGGRIELSTELNDDLLTFVLKDWGREFNPLTYEAPHSETLRIGGLGIKMMKSSFDSIDYQRIDDCNILKMTKNLLAHGTEIQN